MSDFQATEIRLSWPATMTAPSTLLIIKHSTALDAEELRLLADVVAHVEDMRNVVAGAS